MLSTLFFGGLLILGFIRVLVGYAVEGVGDFVHHYKRAKELNNPTPRTYADMGKQSSSLPTIPITDFYEKDEDEN